MPRICSSWSRASSDGAALAGLLAALIAALVASCGSAPRVRRAGTLSARRRPPSAPAQTPCDALSPTDAPRLCALATLDPEARAIEVRLVIPPAALPADRSDVRLAFRDALLGPDYAATAVEIEGGWPETLGAVQERVELAYRVRIGEAPRRGASWARPGGFHVTGASLLPDVLVDGAPASIAATFFLDVGEAPLWTSAGTDERVFDAPSLRRLADEAYEIGPLTTTRREVESTTLWIATSGEEGIGRLEPVADELERALQELAERLGPPATDAALIVFHPLLESGEHREARPGFAERLGASIVSTEGLPRDPRYGLARASVHELGHLWIPGLHDVREEWLAEGVTDYLAALALEALSEASLRERARLALRRHARYASAADGRTLLSGAGDPRWVEDAGLLAGFCLDAHLRESGSSLAAVLRTTLARDESEIGTEALLADLAAVSGSAASHLEALAVTQGAFAIDGCLERLGFHVRAATWEGGSDEHIARELLEVSEVRGFDDVSGLEVLEPLEGSPFEAGDVLLRVAEEPVGALEDVAWAVRDAPPSEAVRVELRRAGEAREIERAVPSVDEDARIERTYLELVPVDR